MTEFSTDHVMLAREAINAGLIVTELMRLKCGHGSEPCYAIQLWTDEGMLWAEGTHEDIEQVRWHIQNYRDEVATCQPDYDVVGVSGTALEGIPTGHAVEMLINPKTGATYFRSARVSNDFS